MQEKYGFIYIWYDRKHQRYYLGRHWGTENDGYICSQSNMRNNFKNRPEDFKRRIVSIVNDKQALVEEEQRWLNMIDVEELGKKYYNINNRATTPTMRGRKHSAETVQKIRSKNIGKTRTEETKQKLRKPKSEEHKKKLSKSKSEEHKKKLSESKKGKTYGYTHSEETKKKMSISHVGRVYSPISAKQKQKQSGIHYKSVSN